MRLRVAATFLVVLMPVLAAGEAKTQHRVASGRAAAVTQSSGASHSLGAKKSPDTGFVDLLHNIWPTIAAIIGGMWLLYLYFKQRQHAVRLDTKVSGTLTLEDGYGRLTISVTAKNVGKVRVPIVAKGTAVRVFLPPKVKGAAWQHHGSRRIFEDQIVEPDESIVEDIVTYVPAPPPPAVRVIAEVYTDRAGWISRTELPLARVSGGNK